MRRGPGAGHHDLVHGLADGVGEVDLAQPLVGDRQVRGGDVPVALLEGREQAVAGHRKAHDLDLEVRLREARVELLLEEPPELVGDAPLLTEIDEVVGGVEGHEHADHAALHHRVEVALPGLPQRLELPGHLEVGSSDAPSPPSFGAVRRTPPAPAGRRTRAGSGRPAASARVQAVARQAAMPRAARAPAVVLSGFVMPLSYPFRSAPARPRARRSRGASSFRAVSVRRSDALPVAVSWSLRIHGQGDPPWRLERRGRRRQPGS